MSSDNENLIELVRAEDFTEDQFIECFSETVKERDIINRLKGPGAHLLEGPRGVGKSSLLRKAELELDDEYSTTLVLSVYVNFKASMLVEAGTSSLGYNPFLCWVTAKLLEAFYKKCRKHQILSSDDISSRYHKLLGISKTASASELENVIKDLQGLTTAQTDQKKKEIIAELSHVKLDRFSNVESISDFIRKIVREKNIKRVNFFFDEAAHTFNEQQQESFFQFFKLLHGDVIAVKAAVYPGITSYGGNFEIGQDAVKITISSIEENQDSSRNELKAHFRELIQKRLPASKYGDIVKRGEALDMLIYLSNGNPRMFTQAVSKWLASKEMSKRSALTASNEFVSAELTNYHVGLAKRLPRFSSHIELGMDLVKSYLVPELQKKNELKGPSPKSQTIYFTIDPKIPYKVQRAISLLEYSGFLYAKSVVKTAGRTQAKRYALHLGVAANEKVFHSSLSRDPDKAIKLLRLVEYREFYASDDKFNELVKDHPSTESCPNGHPRNADGDFCPVCGLRFHVDKVINALLNDSLNNLPISRFLKGKLSEHFEAINIRDVLNLTESKLQEAYQIGPVRARLISNAAEEYISG